MNIISAMAGRVEYDTGRAVINLSVFFFLSFAFLYSGAPLKGGESRRDKWVSRSDGGAWLVSLDAN